MKRVLIVDDSKTFQRVLSHILSPFMEVVGKGSSGLEGFDLYQKLRPDLVLMDITMPNCNGKECLQRILQIDSSAQVIMVSSIGDEQTVTECQSLGAKGFVKKDDIKSTDDFDSPLLNAIRSLIALTPPANAVTAEKNLEVK